MSKREQAIKAAKQQLDELDREIARLESRAADVGEDLKSRYRAEVAKLREQSKKGAAKLEELKSAGESGWDKVAAEFTKITDAMKHSFNYFKSQV